MKLEEGECETHSELSEETIDNLVQDDSSSRNSFRRIRLIRKFDNSPIVGAQEERSEQLFVELEDELYECAEGVLFDRDDVVFVERRRVNSTEIEDRKEQLENNSIVLDDIRCLAVAKSSSEQVEKTENRLTEGAESMSAFSR